MELENKASHLLCDLNSLNLSTPASKESWDPTPQGFRSPFHRCKLEAGIVDK